MGLPVTVYRWDDAGAPQIDGTPSAFIAMLKACLVNGYGAKAALGWTIPFEDAEAYKVAFRNSTSDGSGGFVQIGSKTAINTAGSSMQVIGAKSMISFDNFVDRQIIQEIRIASAATKWVVIGTSVGFWFMTNNQTSSPYSATYDAPQIFCGDYDAIVPNDVGRFIVLGYPAASDMTSSSWSNQFSYSMNANSSCCRIYDTDSTSNSAVYKMDSRYSQGLQAVTGVPPNTRTFYEMFLFSPGNLGTNDRLGVNHGNSAIQPFVRGKIPGLVNTPSVGYSNQAWPVVENLEGSDYMLMSGYLFGRNWIKMDSWYD